MLKQLKQSYYWPSMHRDANLVHCASVVL